jgi:hypothetical protein
MQRPQSHARCRTPSEDSPALPKGSKQAQDKSPASRQTIWACSRKRSISGARCGGGSLTGAGLSLPRSRCFPARSAAQLRSSNASFEKAS